MVEIRTQREYVWEIPYTITNNSNLGWVIQSFGKEGMQAVCLITLLCLQLVFATSDFNALLDLKKGFTNAFLLDSWNLNSVSSNGCPLNWHGITCSNGDVVSIMLNHSRLLGHFDFNILSPLKLLRNLSISGNAFTGTILHVAEIESLENFDISDNSFHGPLPLTFTHLINLVSVNLSTNNFDGHLPSGFRNLKNLNYLDLHSNRFTGNLMNLVTELGGVILLDLSCNQFVGHLDIGLGRASFVSNIQYLNVSNNALVGELFARDGMPFFDSLQVLDATNNHLNGTIPSFNFVVSLRVLRLGNNNLSGPLPEALFQDNSMLLAELDLSVNQLQGPVGSITSTSIRSLNLSSNQLSGTLPMKIGQCVTIDLGNNKISGNLSRIKYWGNYVEVIQLSSNSLSGTLPDETSNFLRLSSFGLSNNSLQGILPPILSSYPELKVLDLSFNQLSGFLLPSLFSSSKLTDLNLSHNNFTGAIPLQTSSDNLSLLSLDLSNNFLTGDFPPEISNFHNLLYLDLASNNIQGSIPYKISDKLIDLNVSFNNLSGIVPENLRRFPEAAFHPGNSLLILPPSSTSSGSSMGQNQSKNRTVIYFILAGIVAGVIILILLFMLIYYRFRMKGNRVMVQKAKREGKHYKSGSSSLPSTSPSHTSVSPSVATPSSGHVAFNSSKMGPTPEAENSRSRMTNFEDVAPHESTKNQGEITLPLPKLSSSSPPASKGQNLFSNHDTMKIGPQENGGDLVLFERSFVFTADQLRRSPSEVIGRSCHGMLYRVTLVSGEILVVKRLKEGIAKGKKEFAREVRKLGNVRHPNLVSLQGYYWGQREHEKLLMSNYVNYPCLGIYLQGSERSKIPYLSLVKQLKVARDISHCLDYLHNEKAIPHGNLKSTNILIDPSEANTLVTDYSLHRLLAPAGTADQVLSAGALGYLPPEFISSSTPCPSLKSDVYAFGVILLELITGRSSAEIVSANQGAVDLTDWVKLLVSENRATDCFDKAGLGVHYSENEKKVLERILQVALSCILPAPERPDIRAVFHDLLSIELN
ncbi:putative inactive receptor kinase At5g10020 [Silene latifolia]|uniref:putative inactive receptor kinase At5g10020 n=1 Tax=Silene latifolia TaxID=37657 RepID=UPI003D78A549